MFFLPRRGLNVAECEIARAFKVAASSIEAIAFIVPRKVRSRVPASHSHMLTPCLQSDSFESDISPLRRLGLGRGERTEGEGAERPSPK